MKLKMVSFKGFLIPLIGIFIWEALPFTGLLVNDILLPPFSDVLVTTVKNLYYGDLFFHIFFTLYRAMLGLLIASCLAIPMGLIIGYNKKIEKYTYLITEFLRPLPPIALVPFGILFLGLFDSMKITIIAFGCFWIILINSISGAKEIKKELIDMYKIYGNKNKKLLCEIVVMSSLAHILTGIKLSLSISLIISVAMDMLVGFNGIGFYIIDSERAFKFSEMYSGLLTLALVGYLVNKIFDKISLIFFMKS